VWVVSDPPCDVRTCAWVASGNSHVLYKHVRVVLEFDPVKSELEDKFTYPEGACVRAGFQQPTKY